MQISLICIYIRREIDVRWGQNVRNVGVGLEETMEKMHISHI